MIRRGMLWLLLLGVLCLLPACGGKEELCVRVLDIGKADAILITNGEHAVLMDTGTAEAEETVLAALDRCGITKLDALIITHFDQDHIGSAPAVLQHVDVERIYQPEYEKESKPFDCYQAALEVYSGELCSVTRKESVLIGAMTFVLRPPKETGGVRSSNDSSLVTALYYGKTSFLLPGDAAEQRLQELLADEIGAFDVLKVPHHGIGEKSSGAFIAMVSPAYAVLTVPDETYADPKVVEALYAVGARVQCTCTGTVLYRSDGRTIRVSTEIQT